jgi:hypothetical protein
MPVAHLKMPAFILSPVRAALLMYGADRPWSCIAICGLGTPPPSNRTSYHPPPSSHTYACYIVSPVLTHTLPINTDTLQPQGFGVLGAAARAAGRDSRIQQQQQQQAWRPLYCCRQQQQQPGATGYGWRRPSAKLSSSNSSKGCVGSNPSHPDSSTTPALSGFGCMFEGTC